MLTVVMTALGGLYLVAVYAAQLELVGNTVLT